jgi:hypothetical protein
MKFYIKTEVKFDLNFQLLWRSKGDMFKTGSKMNAQFKTRISWNKNHQS